MLRTGAIPRSQAARRELLPERPPRGGAGEGEGGHRGYRGCPVGASDQLFLLTLNDLEGRSSAPSHEYDVMGIALLLRKLLLDADALVDHVNRERRLKIRFVINDRPMPNDPVPLMWSMQDGFDPETAHQSFPKEVKKAELLVRPVVAMNGFPIAVKDIIRYVAHVRGAVQRPGIADDLLEPVVCAEQARVVVPHCSTNEVKPSSCSRSTRSHHSSSHAARLRLAASSSLSPRTPPRARRPPGARLPARARRRAPARPAARRGRL